MSIIDGLLSHVRFLLDIPLREPWAPTSQILLNKLGQKERLDVDPYSLNSVVKINRGYLELVDGDYHRINLAALLILPLAIFLDCVILYGTWEILFNQSTPAAETILLIAALVLLLIPMCAILTYRGLKDVPVFTHKPIRLVRSTRTVHIFRHNRRGGVMSLPWDELQFCVLATGINGGIMGYLPDANGHVTHAFNLGNYNPVRSVLLDQWEFIRRYMEEGPDAVPEPEVILPIDGRREPFWFGMLVNFFSFGPFLALAIPMSLITMPAGLFRYVGMHLSRLPRWPQYVQDESRVEPDDPYANKPAPPLGIPYALLIPVTLIALGIDAWFIWWLVESLKG